MLDLAHVQRLLEPVADQVGELPEIPIGIAIDPPGGVAGDPGQLAEDFGRLADQEPRPDVGVARVGPDVDPLPDLRPRP